MPDPNPICSRRAAARSQPAPRAAADPELPEVSPSRVVVEQVQPEIDAGRFPIKRTPGEPVEVTVVVHADGHDVLAGVLRHRNLPAGCDRRRALGRDRARVARQRPLAGDVRGRGPRGGRVHGRSMGGPVRDVAQGAGGEGERRAGRLERTARRRHPPEATPQRAPSTARTCWSRRPSWAATRLPPTGPPRRSRPLSPQAASAAADRAKGTRYGRVLRVTIDRERARFGSWYEMFPRSAGTDPARSATFREAEGRLPGVAAMGFDIVYLPPIHPIGRHLPEGAEQRAPGRAARPRQPVGDRQRGGRPHERRARRSARSRTSSTSWPPQPDARSRSRSTSPTSARPTTRTSASTRSGSAIVRTARSSTRRTRRRSTRTSTPSISSAPTWRSLWQELKRVVEFWCARGVRVFRVDNPHTKSFHFWEWMIADVRRQYPDVDLPRRGVHAAEHDALPGEDRLRPELQLLHVAEHEAGDRPSTSPSCRRPRSWSTCGRTCSRTRPTSCTSSCSTAGRPRSRSGSCWRPRSARATASTAASSSARTSRCGPGSEEYLDSEKYQIKVRDWHAPHSLAPLITRVNQLRREHPALQHDRGLRFFGTDNPSIVCYAKASTDGTDLVLVAVNLDPHNMQHGFVQAPIADVQAIGRRRIPGRRPADRRAVRLEGRVELRPACRPTTRCTSCACRRRRSRARPSVTARLRVLGAQTFERAFDGAAREVLERLALPAFLGRQRWFAAKGRAVRRCGSSTAVRSCRR